MNDKLKVLVEKIAEKKAIEKEKKDKIIAKYKGKKLSLEERIARIEELLNINEQ